MMRAAAAGDACRDADAPPAERRAAAAAAEAEIRRAEMLPRIFTPPPADTPPPLLDIAPSDATPTPSHAMFTPRRADEAIFIYDYDAAESDAITPRAAER